MSGLLRMVWGHLVCLANIAEFTLNLLPLFMQNIKSSLNKIGVMLYRNKNNWLGEDLLLKQN